MALLNNGPGNPEESADISDSPFADMQDIRLAASFFSKVAICSFAVEFTPMHMRWL